MCKQQIPTKQKKSKSFTASAVNSPQSPNPKPMFNPAHMLSDTMYTNVANLQQTMLLQQQLFRQALGHQTSIVTTKPTTSFTTPSLSQYNFVRRQQVRFMVTRTCRYIFMCFVVSELQFTC